MTFHYTADLSLASHVVASLSSVEEHLDEVVTDLRWRVARLHETWDGHASSAHLEAHGSWQASYVEMREALSAMRAAVRTASTNYAAAASANEQMWGGVR